MEKKYSEKTMNRYMSRYDGDTFKWNEDEKCYDVMCRGKVVNQLHQYESTDEELVESIKSALEHHHLHNGKIYIHYDDVVGQVRAKPARLISLIERLGGKNIRRNNESGGKFIIWEV